MRSRGDELRRRFGAHSIGVGRKRVGDRRTDELAVIVYVARKGAATGDAEPVPPTIAYRPPGHEEPVELPTDVVETPPVGVD